MIRKEIILILLFSFLFLIPFPSSAFYSNDKINDNFRYEGLKISGKYLTGYIINTSRNSIKNISFRIYGRKAGTSEFMWEVFLVLGNLNAGEKTPFREYIFDENKGTSIIIFKEHSSYIVRPEPVKSTKRIKEYSTTIKTSPSKPYKSVPSLPKKPLNITEEKDGTVTITQ